MLKSVYSSEVSYLGEGLPDTVIEEYTWIGFIIYGLFYKIRRIDFCGKKRYIDERSFQKWKKRTFEWICKQSGKKRVDLTGRIEGGKGEAISCLFAEVRRIEFIKDCVLDSKLRRYRKLRERKSFLYQEALFNEQMISQKNKDKAYYINLLMQKKHLEERLRRFRMILEDLKSLKEEFEHPLEKLIGQSESNLDVLKNRIEHFTSSKLSVLRGEDLDLEIEKPGKKRTEVQLFILKYTWIEALLFYLFSRDVYKYRDRKDRVHFYSRKSFDAYRASCQSKSHEKIVRIAFLYRDFVDFRVLRAWEARLASSEIGEFFEGLDKQRRTYKRIERNIKRRIQKKSQLRKREIGKFRAYSLAVERRVQYIEGLDQKLLKFEGQLQKQDVLIAQLQKELKKQIQSFSIGVELAKNSLVSKVFEVQELQEQLCDLSFEFEKIGGFQSRLWINYNRDKNLKHSFRIYCDSKEEAVEEVKRIYKVYLPRLQRVEEEMIIQKMKTEEIGEMKDIFTGKPPLECCKIFLNTFKKRVCALEEAWEWAFQEQKGKLWGYKGFLESFKEESFVIARLFDLSEEYVRKDKLLKTRQEERFLLLEISGTLTQQFNVLKKVEQDLLELTEEELLLREEMNR